MASPSSAAELLDEAGRLLELLEELELDAGRLLELLEELEPDEGRLLELLEELELLPGRLAPDEELDEAETSSEGSSSSLEALLLDEADELELPEALLEELSAELEDELPDEEDPELTPPSNETVRVLLVTWLSL